ncbi:hypothetical protein SUGI_0914430 [Cryptomeria japonica]|uniref:subtilisin-like protease SBT4.14 n=1 Tax=Cryptomeria japonica TaxID=3369 RepID=UPI002414BC63|nr:subtilisin-like protease SBT4.14 [Cryptomeria japonica]GLJ43869.1 hypothetical protein SUGI_0914430 [Cryptomeria japonica]
MYKVYWVDGCMEENILAAFDDAIYDGMDVISVSIGFNRPLNYFEDSIAIGSFHAIKRGIFVSNSVGNFGLARASVTNYSPWSLTVVASTIDRKMESELLLGNNISIKGIAVNTNTMEQPWYPIINGSNSDLNALNHIEMKGKIVICDDSSDSSDYTVYLGRGAGLIKITDQFNDIACVWQNPTTVIPTKQGKVVLSYINSTSSLVARILKTTTPKAPAPIVASFSSRGYNPIMFNILKPDITAPRVDILASWARNSSLTESLGDTRHSDFNIISRTSMSCPHSAGVAGFVKSYHNNLSPRAIKSALMTTALVMEPTLVGNGDAKFAYRVGQINPMKAIDPGLVYDIGVDGYVNFLFKEGYNDTTLQLVTGNFSSCDFKEPSKNGPRELN